MAKTTGFAGRACTACFRPTACSTRRRISASANRGAKLLGFAAMKAAAEKPLSPVADTKRLTRGSAYGAEISTAAATADDWPTFRADAARHGSTKTRVDANVTVAWTTTLGGKLTSPVAVGDRVYVAQIDAHTLHAMDVTDGKEAWRFVAGGRIDSPPTIHQGRVLVGSRDGQGRRQPLHRRRARRVRS